MLSGNAAKRPINKREPQPKLAKDIQPPVKLDEHAQKFWRIYSVKLKELRLLSELDLHLLAMAAQWWSVHVRALGEMREITQSTEANGRVAKPEIAIAKQVFNAVRSIMQEFGIGPGSRTKVTVLPEDEDDDPAARYFNNRHNVRRFLG
jgi:P27 family predicted phage terminase small subunit